MRVLPAAIPFTRARLCVKPHVTNSQLETHFLDTYQSLPTFALLWGMPEGRPTPGTRQFDTRVLKVGGCMDILSQWRSVQIEGGQGLD